MKYLALFLISILGLALSCKKETTNVTKTVYLPQETMDFFVNYDTGTCWIYQDTLHANRFDTIELVNKKPMNLNNGGGTLYTGFKLDFTPKKNKNFEIRVGSGSNGSSNVTVDPLVSASGLLSAVENNNQWSGGVIYSDSLLIGKTMYYQVLSFQGGTLYFLKVIYAKNIGLVSFQGLDGHGETIGKYVFVKKMKK